MSSACCAALQFVRDYAKRQRACVVEPAKGLEAYVLTPRKLAERVLRTARYAALGVTLPRSLGAGDMLLVVVHRKVGCVPVQL